MNKVNNLILDRLFGQEEMIQTIGKYLIKSKGKRIRAILTILSSRLFGYQGNNNIRLAAAIEFIHMATLLHDDVIDGTMIRRFLPTASVVWGNKASILVGDFFLSQSFKLIVATESITALYILSNATAVIVSGEVAQLTNLKNKEFINQEQYNKVITAKTSELFAASCEVGAVVSNQKQQHRNALRKFGYNLGYMFQIVDDMLDYLSSSDVVGKTVGADFLESKVTLPLILLYNKMTSSQQYELKKIFYSKEKSVIQFDQVKSLIEQWKIRDDIKQYLQILKNKALINLNNIYIDNKSKYYLKLLIDFLISRVY